LFAGGYAKTLDKSMLKLEIFPTQKLNETTRVAEIIRNGMFTTSS
jgi:mitochondrial fission protein ELM1